MSSAASASLSLDPADWSSLRVLGHRMLDDMFDNLMNVSSGPVWQPMPASVRAAWQEHLPRAGTDPAQVYDDFLRLIVPYVVGNRHPRFFGWVHGGGTPVGMLAELLAGALNANCGGRDHAPIAVERQVVRWAAEMLGLPAESSGLIVSGTSMANFIAVVVARVAALGRDVRKDGARSVRLAAYTSEAAHMCIGRAIELAGIGSAAMRLIPCDAAGRLRPSDLYDRIARDRAEGFTPFLVVGTAGTVETGSVDDLAAIAECCKSNGIWFHVDAAYGAMAMLSDRLRPLLAGIEQADSVAFDFHKWGQVQYDAGCIVVRDANAHRAAFARSGSYLQGAERGLAAGDPWPVDLGPDLSRGFRALKIWMTLKVYGAEQLGKVPERCCMLARQLADLIGATHDLELMAPVTLNVVCFRVAGLDDIQQQSIAADLQESGRVVLSTTVIQGRKALRAAIVNHRTSEADIKAIVEDVTALVPGYRGEVIPGFGQDGPAGGKADAVFG